MNNLPSIKKRLAIFDIDGTLTDSVSIHQSAFIKALEKFGLFNFDTEWSNYKHHTDSYIFKTIFESKFKKVITSHDIVQFEDILYELIYNLTNDNPIKEIKGANSFLKELTCHSDFDVVFATGSLLKPAKLKLLQAGIVLPEDLIITANQIFSREHLVLKAIGQAKHFYSNEKYEQIISFGDGLWDYEASKKINIDFIGIGNKKLLDCGVISFFSNFADVKLFDLMRIEQTNHAIPRL